MKKELTQEQEQKALKLIGEFLAMLLPGHEFFFMAFDEQSVQEIGDKDKVMAFGNLHFIHNSEPGHIISFMRRYIDQFEPNNNNDANESQSNTLGNP